MTGRCGQRYTRYLWVLSHELVYVVVVTVLNARADAPGPHSPEPVADPALAEGATRVANPLEGPPE